MGDFCDQDQLLSQIEDEQRRLQHAVERAEAVVAWSFEAKLREVIFLVARGVRILFV